MADEVMGGTKTKKFVRKLLGRMGTPELRFEEVTQVSAEFLYVFLHVADREAFGTLDEQKRNEFIDTLIDETIYSFVKTLITITEGAVEISGYKMDDFDLEEQELVRGGAYKEFDERHLEYSKCKDLFAEPGEPLGKTVFWEFGSVISQAIGKEKDIYWVSVAFGLAVSALKEINIQDALDKIAS
ncbi:MAG: hypothetical protein RX316_09855 [bacterium]|nr:hypothetical protein [bacterium]